MFKRIVAVALAILVLFPLCYALSLSFFQRTDFYDTPARFLPSSPDISGYVKVLAMPEFARYTFNSIVTATLGALARVVTSFLAAYAFVFLSFKGKSTLLFILSLSAFIPQDALLFENYMTVVKAGLGDTYLGIIAPGLFSAMQMLMLLTAMKALSRDPYEAALLDGAGDRQIMLHIIAPLVKSVIITILIQSFIGTYNAYLWPLVVTNKPQMRTIQIGISLLGFAESGDKSGLFAALVVTLVPFILIVILARKVMIKALTEGLNY